MDESKTQEIGSRFFFCIVRQRWTFIDTTPSHDWHVREDRARLVRWSVEFWPILLVGATMNPGVQGSAGSPSTCLRSKTNVPPRTRGSRCHPIGGSFSRSKCHFHAVLSHRSTFPSIGDRFRFKGGPFGSDRFGTCGTGVAAAFRFHSDTCCDALRARLRNFLWLPASVLIAGGVPHTSRTRKDGKSVPEVRAKVGVGCGV